MGLSSLAGVLFKVDMSEGIIKESVVANLKVIFRHLLENNKTSARKFGVSAEILTG
jgi:hypothetical protein